MLTAASNCYFSHISADDPIVYPGQPGGLALAHVLRGGDDEREVDDRVAAQLADDLPPPGRHGRYWVPTLFAGGVAVRPTKGSAYFALRAHAMHVEEIVQARFEYTRRCSLPSKG